MVIKHILLVCLYDEINEYQIGCEECGIHFNQSWEYDIIVDLWNGEYYKNEQETEKEIIQADTY